MGNIGVLSCERCVPLTYDQAKGVTKGCLSPDQAVVWQVNVLCGAIYVTSSNPSGFKTDRGRNLILDLTCLLC